MREMLAYFLMFLILWAIIEPRELGVKASKIFNEINAGWQEQK